MVARISHIALGWPGAEAPRSTRSLPSLWPHSSRAMLTQHTLGLRLQFPLPNPSVLVEPHLLAQANVRPSLVHSAPQAAGSSSFTGAMSERPTALNFDTTPHPTCLPPAVFCSLDRWPLYPGSAECPSGPCPSWPNSSIPFLFINFHSQNPSSLTGAMPGKNRFLEEEAQVVTTSVRPRPLPT